MAYATWHEYLNARGKLVQKPDTEKVADYNGPDPKSPGKSEPGHKVKDNGSGLENVGPKSKAPTPYRAPGTDPGMKKSEKGFGDEGDKNLVYAPDTDVKKSESKLDTWPTSKGIKEFVQANLKNKLAEAVGPPMGMGDHDDDGEPEDDLTPPDDEEDGLGLGDEDGEEDEEDEEDEEFDDEDDEDEEFDDEDEDEEDENEDEEDEDDIGSRLRNLKKSNFHNSMPDGMMNYMNHMRQMGQH
jgi:hypothetical protein